MKSAFFGTSADPSQNRWSRVLLVEGTSGVGKSTLVDHLVRRFVASRAPRKLRTLLHLTQAHTFGPLVPAADSGTLSAGDNLAHLDNVVSLLEWHVTSLRAESEVKFNAVVDTLHLTQCFRPGVLRWEQVAPLDARLARLDARLLFLRASRDSIWSRGIEPRRNDEFMTGYALGRFGRSLQEVHEYFVAEQEKMAQLLSRTRLRHLEIDADRAVEETASDAYRFWQS